MHPWHYLTLTALVGIAGCTPFQSSAQNTTVDKTEWVTHCFGRFLIDLPPQAQIRAGYDLWGAAVKRLDVPPTSLAAQINQREQELKAQRHEARGSMFLRRINLENGGIGLLSWASDASRVMLNLDTYAISKPISRIYYRQGKISTDREQRGIEIATTLTRNLRSRDPQDIPAEPGFCIDGAYIAGSTFQREGFNVGVSFPDHPGAFFSFSTDTGAEEDQLLDRVGGFLAGAAKMVAGLETLRKGQRNIGPISAQEYLVAGSAEGQRAYSFAWESQGKDGSLSEPNITAGLGVLERDADSHGNPPPPAFRSDQKALELWDAIIDSIRLRPGAVGPSSAQNDTPNASQHGLRVTSGTPCPWPGVWTCDEAPQLGAQTIVHGVPMPSVEGNAVTWRLLRGI
ncbi:T6SS immunity protein Tli4 family protein [Pseudomonas citronellolis]|uniref:T6SS immunity protein Tli4 family protein n=2 Tax=Pseudomonas citronellolis TaxID=53408 RepID=A0AAW6PE01_9PSED|nr:T6SS immunity protein Tli4 family protein [Pseudomonas citronellolis]